MIQEEREKLMRELRAEVASEKRRFAARKPDVSEEARHETPVCVRSGHGLRPSVLVVNRFSVRLRGKGPSLHGTVQHLL